MTEVFVFKGNEQTLASAGNTLTVNSSGAYAAPPAGTTAGVHMTVRLVNPNSTAAIINLANSTFSGNLTMQGNSVIFLQKNALDLVSNATGSGILAGVCGFSY